MRKTLFSTAVSVALVNGTVSTSSDIITANCTGMLDLNVYTFDPDLPKQDVEGIGSADFSMDDTMILLRGAFGTYRFDLKVGTLYHNDSDTGLYCTYSGLKP